MNDESEDVDINYKKGFNHGYYLAQDGGKYLDELLKGLKNTESSYYKALIAGSKQWEKEKLMEQMKQKQPEKTKDLDKDY